MLTGLCNYGKPFSFNNSITPMVFYVLYLPDIAGGMGLDREVDRLKAVEGETTYLTCLANIVMYGPPEMYRERVDKNDILLKSSERLTIEHSK